jgi:hypothetical protein
VLRRFNVLTPVTIRGAGDNGLRVTRHHCCVARGHSCWRCGVTKYAGDHGCIAQGRYFSKLRTGSESGPHNPRIIGCIVSPGVCINIGVRRNDLDILSASIDG